MCKYTYLTKNFKERLLSIPGSNFYLWVIYLHWVANHLYCILFWGNSEYLKRKCPKRVRIFISSVARVIHQLWDYKMKERREGCWGIFFKEGNKLAKIFELYCYNPPAVGLFTEVRFILPQEWKESTIPDYLQSLANGEGGKNPLIPRTNS